MDVPSFTVAVTSERRPVRRAHNGGGWVRPASDILFEGSNKDGTVIPGAFLNRTNGYNHDAEVYGTTGYPVVTGSFGAADPAGGSPVAHSIRTRRLKPALLSFHPSGLHALMGDGSVKFLDEGLSIGIAGALLYHTRWRHQGAHGS